MSYAREAKHYTAPHSPVCALWLWRGRRGGTAPPARLTSRAGSFRVAENADIWASVVCFQESYELLWFKERYQLAPRVAGGMAHAAHAVLLNMFDAWQNAASTLH